MLDEAGVAERGGAAARSEGMMVRGVGEAVEGDVALGAREGVGMSRSVPPASKTGGGSETFAHPLSRSMEGGP